MKKDDKITWKPIVKINNIEVKPLKIDLKKFNNYAIFISKNFQEMCFCPALISEPVKTHKYGVIPSQSKNTFNCCVGDYDEMCVDILIYTPYCSYNKAKYYFRAFDVWANVNNIYSKKIGIDLLNNMLEDNDGFRGYFYNKNVTIKKILKLRNSYIQSLETSIKLTASEDTIKIALSAVKELKNVRNKDL